MPILSPDASANLMYVRGHAGCFCIGTRAMDGRRGHFLCGSPSVGWGAGNQNDGCGPEVAGLPVAA